MTIYVQNMDVLSEDQFHNWIIGMHDICLGFHFEIDLKMRKKNECIFLKANIRRFPQHPSYL